MKVESPILPKVENKKSIKNDSTIIELLDRNLLSNKEIEMPLKPKNLLDKTRIMIKQRQELLSSENQLE